MHCKCDIKLMYHAQQSAYVSVLWRLSTRGQHVTWISQLGRVHVEALLNWNECDWVNDDLLMNRSSGEIQAQVFELIKCRRKADNWTKKLQIVVRACVCVWVRGMMVRW